METMVSSQKKQHGANIPGSLSGGISHNSMEVTKTTFSVSDLGSNVTLKVLQASEIDGSMLHTSIIQGHIGQFSLGFLHRGTPSWGQAPQMRHFSVLGICVCMCQSDVPTLLLLVIMVAVAPCYMPGTELLLHIFSLEPIATL